MRRLLPLAVVVVALAAGPGLLGGGDARAADVGGTWQWRGLIVDAANRHGLPPGLLQAIVCTESGGDPNARSGAGAIGLAQVMYFNAHGANLWDPAQNLDVAAAMLQRAEDSVGGWAPLPDPRGTWQASINAYLYGHPFYGDTGYFEQVMGCWYQIAAAGG